MKRFVLVLTVIAVCAGISFAKPVSKKQISAVPSDSDSSSSQASNPASSGEERTALGFNSQVSINGVTSLSLRQWGPGQNGFETIAGFCKGDNSTIVDLGLKLLHRIKKEQHLTVYSFGLLGIEPYSVNSKSDTNLELEAGLGVEFFFQELPNLGFGAEVGLGYNSGTKLFQTIAGWIPSVGIRYYYK